MKRIVKKVSKNIFVLWMVCSLLVPNLIVLADQEVSLVQQPSQWAIEGLNKSHLYELSTEDLFNDFQEYVTGEELSQVIQFLYPQIVEEVSTVEELINTIDKENFVTREEVGNALGTLIQMTQPTLVEGEGKGVDYLITKEILKGNGKNNLALEKNCTREELLVLASRVYEFVVHETGQASKGLFWKIADEDSEVYVLGSIHMADRRIYPFSKNIEKAYEMSQYLAVEASIIEDQEGIQYMQAKAFYDDENTFKDNVSAETYEATLEILAMYQIGEAELEQTGLNKVKPWFMAMFLQSLGLTEGTAVNATLGVDYYFLSKALGTKEIIEIEGIKFQVDLFDSFSAEIQEQFLADTLQGIGSGDEEENISQDVIDYMLDLWKQGDGANLAELLEQSKATGDEDEFTQKFWTERDKNMVDSIVEFLADQEQSTYFVVVGAGHVVGETGIIKLLEEQGYIVEQIID